ncbi:MAG: hypothetical protein AAGE94_22660, partial [Acidobacteriota bacterium]
MHSERSFLLSSQPWLVVLIAAVSCLSASHGLAQDDRGPSGGDTAVIECDPIDWADTLGSGFSDDARGVAAYDFGGKARGEVYITGSFQGGGFNPAHFGASTSNQIPNRFSHGGSRDVYVAKLDDCGRWLWVRTGGGFGADAGEAVVVDSQRNVIVVGTMDGTGSLDMEVGIPNSEPQFQQGWGVSTVFAAKYNHQGVLQWFRTLGDGAAFDVDVDSNDDVILTRTILSTGSGTNAGALIRLSGATGVAMPQQAFVAENLMLTGVSVGDQDRFCVVGNFKNTIQIGNQFTSAINGFPSVFVALLDPSGAPHQIHVLTSSQGEVAANAAATTLRHETFVGGPGGSIYEWDCLAAGRFSGFLPVGIATLSSGFSADRDGWVARFRWDEPDPISALHVGGSGHQEVMDVALRDDASGQMWITGFFNTEMLAWDAEQIHESLASWTTTLTAQSQRDAFLIGYGTASGAWPTSFESAGNDEGRGIFVQPQS